MRIAPLMGVPGSQKASMAVSVTINRKVLHVMTRQVSFLSRPISTIDWSWDAQDKENFCDSAACTAA